MPPPESKLQNYQTHTPNLQYGSMLSIKGLNLMHTDSDHSTLVPGVTIESTARRLPLLNPQSSRKVAHIQAAALANQSSRNANLKLNSISMFQMSQQNLENTLSMMSKRSKKQQSSQFESITSNPQRSSSIVRERPEIN